MLGFINAQRNVAANITAHVDSLAIATFVLEYLDDSGQLIALGPQTPAADTYSWPIDAGLLAQPKDDVRGFRLSFVPALQVGVTNLWLTVAQGATQLIALNHPDPGNVHAPYRACSAMNGTNTHYEFAVRVA